MSARHDRFGSPTFQRSQLMSPKHHGGSGLDSVTPSQSRHASGVRRPGSNTGTKPNPNKPIPPPITYSDQQAIEVDVEGEDKWSCKQVCKRVLKFSFSHIGLCGMVIAYSAAGGFIFEHLEKTNEQQECLKSEEKYLPSENSTMYKLWEVGQNFLTEDGMDDALIEYQKLLRRFRDDVLSLGYDGKNCSAMGMEGGPGFQWSLAGSLLFAVTVITTIGYGNIAPKTFWGRLVCMAYAVLGIPLMLLCLANIGDVMADIFRYVYSKICCCGCCRKKRKKTADPANDQDGSAGNGPRTPEAWKAQYEKQGAPIVVDDDDDDDDEDDEDENISVPLTITMGVIAGYIMMGAVLFSAWEGWDSLKSAYYCFVTISTIGFGDVVPGSANFETVADQYKMIFSAVYMLFGMAILSMCFSLIQEEIVSKFKWLGEKMGIVDKEKEEEESEEVVEIDNSNDSSPPPQESGSISRGEPVGRSFKATSPVHDMRRGGQSSNAPDSLQKY